MWLSAAQSSSNAYLVVVLGAVLSASLLALGWAIKKLGDHDKDIAVLKERSLNNAQDIADLKNPGQVTRLQRRER